MSSIVSVPNIRGISEIQRKGKKALTPILNNSAEPSVIFVSDRNKLFAVIINIKDYEDLIQKSQDQESVFWLKATESSLDFWRHPSNDIYETLL